MEKDAWRAKARIYSGLVSSDAGLLLISQCPQARMEKMGLQLSVCLLRNLNVVQVSW